MSLREIRRKINLIEAAIKERQKKLSIIEGEKNAENIVKIPLLKNEIEILHAEKGRLVEEGERLKTHFEQSLLKAEKEYLQACEEQSKLLKKLCDITERFLSYVEEVKDSTKLTHHLFIPYKNISLELEKTPKSLHIEGLYSLNEKIITQIKTFYEWARERVDR